MQKKHVVSPTEVLFPPLALPDVVEAVGETYFSRRRWAVPGRRYCYFISIKALVPNYEENLIKPYH